MDFINNYWWLLLISIVALLYWVIFKKKKTGGGPTGVVSLLTLGWEFFPNPTTANPPGTIFRVTPDKRKFHVATLPINYHEALESLGTNFILEATDVNIGARLLGKKNLDIKIESSGDRSSKFQFSIESPVREYAGDDEIDEPLASFYKELKKSYRARDKYYIIYETIKGDGMTYELSQNQVMKLGGEAQLKEVLTLKNAPIKVEKKNNYELKETFKKPMRILLLTEEIRPASYGLSDEELKFERVPVTTAINWIEEE